MRIKKGVMTSTDENSSSIIPFFPYTMEDCVVSKITEDEVRKVVINPTEISDSGASVGRVTAVVDNGNGRVIFRPNGECKVIFKIGVKSHSNLVLNEAETGKNFEIDMLIPLKYDLSNIAGVSCFAGVYGDINGAVMLTGTGYELYDKGDEHRIKVRGLLYVDNVDDKTLEDKLCITVIIDYM